MTIDELLNAWVSLIGTPPNSEQYTVMEHADGPLWVIAGPGTGKTYALILRCLFLLCVCRITPSTIVLTTFTRKVAEELEHRLQEALLRLSTIFPELRKIDLSQMRLGTLHSLCWSVLTETPGSPFRHLQSLSALDRAFFVYSRSRFCRNDQGNETEELFLQLVSWIDKKSYRTLPSRWRRVPMFIKMYECLMNYQIDRARFAAFSPAFKLLIQLIEEYEAELCKSHFTDQTLIQQQALEILRTHPIAQDIQYVIVDEYQDTNPLQAAIYRALAATPPHSLCVVGDDDQALYRFRGGTVSCIVHFADECKQIWPDCEVKHVALTETYRSHPAIVDWINGYITTHPQMSLPNARVLDKPPLRAQPSSYPTAPVVLAIRGKKPQEVASNFLKVLTSLKKLEVIESYAQCALLAYSIKPTKEAGPYIKELQEQGIPITFSSSSKDQQVYQQILGTLLIALDRSGNLIPANFAENNTSLARYVEGCRQLAQADPVLSVMARQITTWLLTQPGAARTMSLTKLAQRIMNAQPCIEALQKDKGAEMATHVLIQTLDSYDRIVGRGYGIPLEEQEGLGKKRVEKRWMERIYRVLVEGVQQEQLERGEDRVVPSPTDAMRILTIHNAKGLEFPVVAVVVDKGGNVHSEATHRLEQDILPFRQDLVFSEDSTPELILGGDEEARAVQDIVRRYFVAYSRAQSVLLLLVCDDSLKSSPLALGLGTDEKWFSKQVETWPPQRKKGGEQHGLWG